MREKLPAYWRGLLVSEKLKKRQLSFRGPHTPEAQFPRTPLLGFSVNRGNPLQTEGSPVEHLARSSVVLAFPGRSGYC